MHINIKNMPESIRIEMFDQAGKWACLDMSRGWFRLALHFDITHM